MNTKTKRQKVGQKGEDFIVKNMDCPQCKRSGTLKCLPANFKCADIICDFCGHTSQVKTFTKATEGFPDTILGAAWLPQKERMDAGIFHTLWLVRVDKTKTVKEVFTVPKEVQTKEMFKPREPLKETAKRAGWQGFLIELKDYKNRVTQIKNMD